MTFFTRLKPMLLLMTATMFACDKRVEEPPGPDVQEVPVVVDKEAAPSFAEVLTDAIGTESPKGTLVEKNGSLWIQLRYAGLPFFRVTPHAKPVCDRTAWPNLQLRSEQRAETPTKVTQIDRRFARLSTEEGLAALHVEGRRLVLWQILPGTCPIPHIVDVDLDVVDTLVAWMTLDGTDHQLVEFRDGETTTPFRKTLVDGSRVQFKPNLVQYKNKKKTIVLRTEAEPNHFNHRVESFKKDGQSFVRLTLRGTSPRPFFRSQLWHQTNGRWSLFAESERDENEGAIDYDFSLFIAPKDPRIRVHFRHSSETIGPDAEPVRCAKILETCEHECVLVEKRFRQSIDLGGRQDMKYAWSVRGLQNEITFVPATDCIDRDLQTP